MRQSSRNAASLTHGIGRINQVASATLGHEPETPWHTGWKKRFAEGCREVVIGEHRADVKANYAGFEDSEGAVDCVIELQHSPIEPLEILEREQFYTKFCHSMVWVIDASEIKDHFVFSKERTTNAGATIT